MSVLDFAKARAAKNAEEEQKAGSPAEYDFDQAAELADVKKRKAAAARKDNNAKVLRMKRNGQLGPRW